MKYKTKTSKSLLELSSGVDLTEIARRDAQRVISGILKRHDVTRDQIKITQELSHTGTQRTVKLEAAIADFEYAKRFLDVYHEIFVEEFFLLELITTGEPHGGSMSNEEEFLDAVVAGDKEEISRLLGQAVDINSTDYGDLHSWVSYVMDAEHAFRLKELLDELDPLDLSGHYYTLLKDPEKQLVEKAWRVGRRFTAHEPSYNLPSNNKAYEGTSADSEPFNSGAAGALAICFIFAMVGIYVLLVVPQNPGFEGHYNRGNEQSQYKNYEDVTQTKEHPSLKTEAARLLKEQGYRDITLLGSPEEEACQRRETEEVIDGVVQKTQESYDGFRFEAGVANTNIKLDGTVCPEIDAVKVKDE